MTDTETLVDSNRDFLRQAQRLILSITDESYVHSDGTIHQSGVGAHLRHVIEHYQRFLIGTRDGEVNYDARQRDMRIATDRNFACSVMEQVVEGLVDLGSEDAEVSVRMASSGDSMRTSDATQSSINRELQYLVAHTVHHYALIGFILRLQGIVPPEDFGIAPSTLQHFQAR
ncbi:MAG: hypothetical protein O3A57_04130 [Bacteroidetes bacterium]|nr:hypothetical protein [Bacteroidota bacterium]